jgi:hypothetical protein
LQALVKLRDPRVGAFIAERIADLSAPVVEVLPALAPTFAGACIDPLLGVLSKAPDGNARIHVIQAIGQFPSVAARAVPLLRAEIARARSGLRVATRVLGDWGAPVATPALPDVEALLEAADPFLRVNAARAVVRLGGRVQRAVEIIANIAFVNATRPDTYAIDTLGELGPVAHECAARLVPLFDSQDSRTASSAAIAHYRITGRAHEALPVLLRHASPSRHGVEVVRMLGEIGPPAREIAPTLRASLESEAREITSGIASSIVDDDEAWVEACRGALALVERA